MYTNLFAKIVFSAVFLGAVVSPSDSSAYWITDEQQVAIGEHATLFVVKYRDGDPKTDIGMPIGAVRVSSTDEQLGSPYLKYSIVDADKSVQDSGLANAFVFSGSQTEIRDAQYVVEKGFSREFFLIVLLSGIDRETELAVEIEDVPSTELSD
jgi:hypothetical protein